MIEVAVEGGSITEKMVESDLGSALRGIKDTFRHFWLLIRCSVLGNQEQGRGFTGKNSLTTNAV